MNEETSSANAEGIFEPFHVSRVPWEEFFRGERFGMRYQHLSRFGGGSQISVAMEVLPPGRQANQAHFHMREEEHVLVLEGSLTLLLGAKSYEMGAGHYVCFPAGQKLGHALINRTAEPCRYLVLGNPHPHAKVMSLASSASRPLASGFLPATRTSFRWVSKSRPEVTAVDYRLRQAQRGLKSGTLRRAPWQIHSYMWS